MPFRASAVFGFTSSTLAKRFPVKTFFIPGNKKKKVAPVEIGGIGRVGHRGPAVLGQKLPNTQRSVGKYTCKSLIMKWANALKESSKKTH